MTRINCIPPKELTDKHLVAEYRELPRIFGLAHPDKLTNIPEHYVLGKGHMTFFYNKLMYLYKRHRQLVAEMHQRGFVTNYLYPPTNPHKELYNNWTPTPEAMTLNRARIKDRLSPKPPAVAT